MKLIFWLGALHISLSLSQCRSIATRVNNSFAIRELESIRRDSWALNILGQFYSMILYRSSDAIMIGLLLYSLWVNLLLKSLEIPEFLLNLLLLFRIRCTWWLMILLIHQSLQLLNLIFQKLILSFYEVILHDHNPSGSLGLIDHLVWWYIISLCIGISLIVLHILNLFLNRFYYFNDLLFGDVVFGTRNSETIFRT